ncbi:hypothetical protein AOLI_G00167480 [Acnodon oligacanthus]
MSTPSAESLETRESAKQRNKSRGGEPASRAICLTCVGGRWLSQERRADLKSACWERISSQASQADHAFRKNRMRRRQEAESVAY